MRLRPLGRGGTRARHQSPRPAFPDLIYTHVYIYVARRNFLIYIFLPRTYKREFVVVYGSRRVYFIYVYTQRPCAIFVATAPECISVCNAVKFIALSR